MYDLATLTFGSFWTRTDFYSMYLFFRLLRRPCHVKKPLKHCCKKNAGKSIIVITSHLWLVQLDQASPKKASPPSSVMTTTIVSGPSPSGLNTRKDTRYWVYVFNPERVYSWKNGKKLYWLIKKSNRGCVISIIFVEKPFRSQKQKTKTKSNPFSC